jgi:type I restriction enzyme M protein
VEIQTTLDNIIRVLRSDKDLAPTAAIEQICFLIFLKLLDDEENCNRTGLPLSTDCLDPVHSRFPAQAERFRWSKWCGKQGTELLDFVRDDVFSYMGSLVREDAQVAKYFRDGVLEIADPAVFKLVVDELGRINFKLRDIATAGCIFESLLNGFIQAPYEGNFHTPQPIREVMVAMVDPQPGDTIHDPTCGTGGLLVDSLKHILAKCTNNIDALSNLESSLSGADVSRQMARIATMNLILHGIRKPRITQANTLSQSGGLSQEELVCKYTAVLCDPPRDVLLQQEPIRREFPRNARKSELLFTYLVIESLAPGGRAAIVVPEGLLFASTAMHIELRKKLVEDFELLAVVSLPTDAYEPFSSTKSNILVFQRPFSDQTSKTSKTMFYEIGEGVFAHLIKSGGNISTNKKIQGFLSIWNEYLKTGFEYLTGHERNSPLEPESEHSHYWWETRETIAANDYNLASGQYRPQINETTEEESHSKLIQELLSLEQDLVCRLEKLLSTDRHIIPNVEWMRERIGTTREQLKLLSKIDRRAQKKQ